MVSVMEGSRVIMFELQDVGGLETESERRDLISAAGGTFGMVVNYRGNHYEKTLLRMMKHIHNDKRRSTT